MFSCRGLVLDLNIYKQSQKVVKFQEDDQLFTCPDTVHQDKKDFPLVTINNNKILKFKSVCKNSKQLNKYLRYTDQVIKVSGGESAVVPVRFANLVSMCCY